MALPPPFPLIAHTAGFVPGGPLQTMLADKLSKSAFKADFDLMPIAVADLTTINEGDSSKTSAKVASNALWEKETAIGSLVKIATMCAAFRLREQVKLAAAAADPKAKSAAEVVAQINKEWKTVVSQAIPKSPNDFPNLSRVFDFGKAAPWEPQFESDNKTLKALKRYDHGSRAVIDMLKFLERMKLMIRFSDNMSSGSCIREIGFQYTNKSLAADGFADNSKNGFLWNGGDIGYTSVPPKMGPPPWDTGKDATWVRGNARGVLSFLTLLWTNRLVSPKASADMRGILEDADVGLGTYLGNGTPNRLRSFSKTGILPGNVSEGIIVECQGRAGEIRYAAVGLNATRSAAMTELGSILFECVKAQH